MTEDVILTVDVVVVPAAVPRLKATLKGCNSLSRAKAKPKSNPD